MSELTTYLYARPSFVEGMARVIDVGGTLTEYNRAVDGKQADYLALLADWRQVGMDLQAAIATHGPQILKDRASVQAFSEVQQGS